MDRCMSFMEFPSLVRWFSPGWGSPAAIVDYRVIVLHIRVEELLGQRHHHHCQANHSHTLRGTCRTLSTPSCWCHYAASQGSVKNRGGWFCDKISGGAHSSISWWLYILRGGEREMATLITIIIIITLDSAGEPHTLVACNILIWKGRVSMTCASQGLKGFPEERQHAVQNIPPSSLCIIFAYLRFNRKDRYQYHEQLGPVTGIDFPPLCFRS